MAEASERNESAESAEVVGRAAPDGRPAGDDVSAVSAAPGAGSEYPGGPGSAGAEVSGADPGTVPDEDGPTERLSRGDGPPQRLAAESLAGEDGPTVPLPGRDEMVSVGAETVPIRSGVSAAGPVAPVRRLLRRLTAANAMIAVLLALLGFTLVVQLRTNSTDASLETARQEDLVRILSDLEAQEERVRQDIAGLEESQRQLNSGAEGRQAALDEATRRADELGILAGTLPARGPGLTVGFMPVSKPIAASRVLDAVQELRGAGAEAMQISGADGATVRIVASTYFLDADGGISVSGRRLTGPYMITVIGDPKTMQTALNIPGGVVASVSGDGGNVAIQEREMVDVSAVSSPKDLQHARPVS
ncbi:DUF881 domain-containing protein [Micromonospora sp. WMMD1102]|uniref:DUF881 domain-containing protein n=1 Tax=Micromonospora sp. WMMD1102 TaxID=3016105 RepID=UPI002415574C|nr:DUF881 domain-containing protein [Micromonospora sp. WMMD1102]MDG4787010.1 DUF881 domain-containing protein [Micromonospora sp. WMMD1102]